MPRRIGPPPAQRCKHELVRTECADCKEPRRPAQRQQQPRYRSKFSREFPAAFDGECSQCFALIYEGDSMRMSDGEPWCSDCADGEMT